jgi:hypothetical protein
MPRTRAAPAFTGDAAVVEIGGQARALAETHVRRDVADDIAQGVVLECSSKIHAGRWSVRHADLTNVLWGVVRERVLDWRRCRALGHECNAEQWRDLEDSEHASVSPDWWSAAE